MAIHPTLSVRVGEVVVVFACLIIPATISVTLVSHLGLQITVIWTSAVLASLGGLLFAYYLDFPIGPAIALFLGCELVITSLIARCWLRP
jgi:ABC-type Mn2+/Zn2+ transport system permease subunit